MRQNEKEMKQLRGQDPRRSSALIIRHTLTQADGKDSLATCAALTESRKTLFLQARDFSTFFLSSQIFLARKK